MALTHPLTLGLSQRERGLTPVRVRKLIQKGFGFLEIGRVKTLRVAQPHGPIRSRCVDAGWRAVCHRGPLHSVCSRQGTARKLLGRVPEAPALSAAGRRRAYETR
jgi:hypothetical protein